METKIIRAKARFAFRSQTLEEWESENPILLAGEHGVVTEGRTASHTEKIGDGVTAWNDLMWWTGGSGGGTSDYEDLENKPQINSVELSGNKSLDNLGIQKKFADVTDEDELTMTLRNSKSVIVRPVAGRRFSLRDGYLRDTTANDITENSPNSQVVNKGYINKVGYVSVNGSDSNVGDFEHPFATVSHAIAVGCRNILVFDGKYEQTIALPDRGTVKISPAEPYSIPIFINPDRMEISSATVHSGNVYVADTDFSLLNNTPIIIQDGVVDTSTLIAEDDRMPQQKGKEYRCDDTVIHKCAKTTLEEAITEMQNASNYRFFYDADNSELYFTAPNNDFVSHPICCGDENTKLFTNLSRAVALEISGIECKYMRFDISNTVNSVVSNCKTSCAYASATGQFVFNNSLNPRFINCEACISYGENNGDGFNGHASRSDTSNPFGHQSGTVLENCWAHDNSDDGYSEHYRGESTIYGGLFEYNGKGGITPAYGTHCTCYNVYSRHNRIGFYFTGDARDGVKYGQLICYDCVSQDNNYQPYGKTEKATAGYLITGDHNTATLIRCVALDNDTAYRSYKTSDNNNKITLIECSGSNNTTLYDDTYGTIDVIDTKQDKLTAGTGITIDENNVISASGGGSTIYRHIITFTKSVGDYITFIYYSTDSTPFEVWSDITPIQKSLSLGKCVRNNNDVYLGVMWNFQSWGLNLFSYTSKSVVIDEQTITTVQQSVVNQSQVTMTDVVEAL